MRSYRVLPFEFLFELSISFLLVQLMDMSENHHDEVESSTYHIFPGVIRIKLKLLVRKASLMTTSWIAYMFRCVRTLRLCQGTSSNENADGQALSPHTRLDNLSSNPFSTELRRKKPTSRPSEELIDIYARLAIQFNNGKAHVLVPGNNGTSNSKTGCPAA